MFTWGRVVLGTLLLGSLVAGPRRASGDEAADKAAIRQAAADYLAAIQQGNADKIAACWTAEGDFVDASGHVRNGRQLALSAAKTPPEQRPLLLVESLRFATREIAIEDGLLEQSGSDFLRYTAIWIRRDGNWLLDGVREAAYAPESHHDHLRPLAWMVGEWQSAEDSPVRVEGSCHWSRERNFLLRKVRVSGEPGQTISISQRIGWDPQDKQIRVWSFDTNGGHSEGVWSHDGNHWIVSTRSVTPEGQPAESRNTYLRLNEDSFSVESSSVVDGEAVPDQKLRLVRKTK